MADTLRELLDDDGENRALRTFLMQYGSPGLTVGEMRDHMKRSGWGGEYWPFFVSASNRDAHLSKGGAQLWIRHLLSLERPTPPSPSEDEMRERRHGEALSKLMAPSPSTAPEVGERAAFEAWAVTAGPWDGPLQWGRHSNGEYKHSGIEGDWKVWQARAALASRPAEVDDEGLPELPPESARASKGKGQFYMKWSQAGKDLRGELLLFTAEQYRQGQRDAVAADRARRGDEKLPAVLFDGHAVYSEITRKLGKAHCHNHETVSATLDAVVRLMRAAPAERAP